VNLTARAVPAPAVRRVSRPGLIQRCGGIDCPPGTCNHTDDPADAAVHRSADAAKAVGSTGVPGSVLRELGTAGTPLDPSTRATMEARLGHAFGHVRVHTDAEAARSAKAIRAHAYTYGSHIVMGAGRFQPHTPSGSRLLAHELTHVVQQASASPLPTPTSVSDPGDAAEREAADHARAVTAGPAKAQTAAPAPRPAVHRTIGDGHDLTATRFAGNLVLEAVFDDERLLRKGDKGTAVRLVQESLLAQGYALPAHGADGDFGPETETTVRQFQVDAGAVKLDGIIGPETMGLLDMHDTGATSASGRLAAPPAPGAPAAPAATGVVFSEDPDEPFAGYDDSVAPNWLVVPANGRRRAAAAIAPAASRPTFGSSNAAVATVDVTPDGVAVTGVAAGTAEVQAMEGAAVLDRLRISVKNRLDRSVAFHYVCDSAVPVHHCSNGTPGADQMRSLLNRVWERQANVRFTGGAAHNVVAPGDLGPAVDWTSPGGGEWNTVTALGAGADYNVFRVWHYLQDGQPTNDAACLGVNTLIGDHPCADGLGLAHETGHFLGLDHGDGFIMVPCGGRVDQRVSKAIADRVNP
jgi:peptidoglycan hydrolase-like protein with peptidoglycan-binding domain